MPTKTTPRDAYSLDSFSKKGCSRRQGPHQVPQKLTTATLPRSIELENSPGRRVAPLKDDTGFLWPCGTMTALNPVATPICPPEAAQPVASVRNASTAV